MRRQSESDGIQELVVEIRRYVSAHPSAADTVEGIRSVWLGAAGASLELVQAGLDHLVAEGFLESKRDPGDSTIYGRRVV